jgi:large subunit ribosomal protein L4
MPELAVKNFEGEQVDTLTLSDEVFGVPVNSALMHQAVTRILADQRLGTHKAKSRGEVKGGGAKPWRQKGTGRARQGSRRSPIWKGGGVAFPPVPRQYTTSMPKKMRRQATRSALSSRVSDQGIVLVSSLALAEPKTRAMVVALEKLEVRGKVLLIDQTVGPDTSRASRNIPGVETRPASTLSIVDVLGNDYLVFSVDAIRHLERLLTDANV